MNHPLSQTGFCPEVINNTPTLVIDPFAIYFDSTWRLYLGTHSDA